MAEELYVEELYVGKLYKVRRNVVDIVDVPELGYIMADGSGGPEDEPFAAAVEALYTVSYGAKFLVKKELGEAPKVGPLEALWWVDDPAQFETVKAVARGEADMTASDRSSWRWRAMIRQAHPIDAEWFAKAVDQARAKKSRPALDHLRYERWTEGRCAQLLHVGPYSAEAPSIARLHQAIESSGLRPRARHHEIYLSDARRTTPENLRTILRQPIEAVSG